MTRVEPAWSGFEPVSFGFPDLPALETDVLLSQPPLVLVLAECTIMYIVNFSEVFALRLTVIWCN